MNCKDIYKTLFDAAKNEKGLVSVEYGLSMLIAVLIISHSYLIFWDMAIYILDQFMDWVEKFPTN